MGGNKSRDKGQRGEREIIELIKPIVDEVYILHLLNPPKLKRNTLQSDGGGSDIAGLTWLSIEVKMCEQFNLNSWWQQTLDQSIEYGGIPVLFYRKNKVKWRVRMLGRIGNVQTLVDIAPEAWLIWFRRELTYQLQKTLA